MHKILYTAPAVFVLFAQPIAAQQITRRIPLQPGPEPEEIAVVTFDQSRVSVEDVTRWMRLHERGYYSTPIVVGNDPECEGENIPNLKEIIRKTRQIVDELDPDQYPPELSRVVLHLKQLQSFWLWLSEQELAYFETRDVPNPAAYGDIDLSSCSPIADRARNQQNSSRACRLYVASWQNCVNHRVQHELGGYPKEEWKAFLHAYGIQERIESTIPD